MSQLNLSVSEHDLPVIRRMKKSLLKRFKITSENDISEATKLANYLYAIGEVEEATNLIDSFVRVYYQEEEGHLWSANAQAIVLMSFIAGINSDVEEQEKYRNLIRDNDICSTHYSSRYEWLKECLEDHLGNVDYALTETQKYKCEILGQEALTFLYFRVMLPFYESEAPPQIGKELDSLIERCYEMLRAALEGTPVMDGTS